MTEDRAKYITEEDAANKEDPIAAILKLLGIEGGAYADKLRVLAEKNYRSIANELRWIIDQAYGEQIIAEG